MTKEEFDALFDLLKPEQQEEFLMTLQEMLNAHNPQKVRLRCGTLVA